MLMLSNTERATIDFFIPPGPSLCCLWESSEAGEYYDLFLLQPYWTAPRAPRPWDIASSYFSPAVNITGEHGSRCHSMGKDWSLSPANLKWSSWPVVRLEINEWHWVSWKPKLWVMLRCSKRVPVPISIQWSDALLSFSSPFYSFSPVQFMTIPIALPSTSFLPPLSLCFSPCDIKHLHEQKLFPISSYISSYIFIYAWIYTYSYIY